jgi:endonuclease/exonuclease/phosphatase family metal-dependent hydrolase
MTWNIHGGLGPDGLHDLDRILALIRRADPDVLALQEVDSRRAPGAEHPIAIIKRVLGHDGVSAAAIVTPDGDYGQVLLSRWPMSGSEVHDISVPGREPRRAITAVVNAPAGQLFVLATHLGLRFMERQHQCRQMSTLADHSTLTTVVMGDFNDWMWPGSVQSILAAKLPARTPHRTFPARFPLLKLDRIYCRPAPALLSSRVDRTAGEISDHLPIIAEIRPDLRESSEYPNERSVL